MSDQASVSRFSVVSAIMERLGISADQARNDFDARFMIQKTVYLLQLHPEFSRFLAFRFNLYLRGPYSPDLARVYFSQTQESPRMPELSQSAKEYLETVLSLSPDSLELISSVIEAIRINPGLPEESIVERVYEIKGDRFAKKEIEQAYKDAMKLKKEFGLQF